MLKLAIEQLDSRTTARLAQIKDGYTPVKGKDYFDGKTPVAGIDFPLPEKGDPGVDADVQEAVRLTIPQVIAELDKRIPLLGDALRSGLDQHIKDAVLKHSYSMGGGAVVSIMQSGTLKVQQAANLDFKGAGAPTVTIGSNGVTHLDFPAGSFGGTQEKSTTTPNGSQQTFAFIHTPRVIMWNGQFQTLTDDYTVSSNSIIFTGTNKPQTGDKVVNIFA